MVTASRAVRSVSKQLVEALQGRLLEFPRGLQRELLDDSRFQDRRGNRPFSVLLLHRIHGPDYDERVVPTKKSLNCRRGQLCLKGLCYQPHKIQRKLSFEVEKAIVITLRLT